MFKHILLNVIKTESLSHLKLKFMKTIISFYPYLKTKLLNKKPVLFLAAIVITLLFVSCTADEIDAQPFDNITKDVNLQNKDTILNVPSTSNTINSGPIDPPTAPVKGNNPPPPPNP